jgi:potassium-transporting ATPase KdpC subunit
MDILRTLRTAALLLIVMVVVTGLIYPIVMVGIGQGLFGSKANGSLIYYRNRAVGSALIGQTFGGAGYFHPRPSATGYDGAVSGASNFGPTSRALMDSVESAAKAFPAEKARGSVPVDIATSSGSGLDPDISVAAAKAQAPGIAQARGVDEREIEAIIDDMEIQRQLGIFGEVRLNVLTLNIELDKRIHD